jgi:hypothetical protein
MPRAPREPKADRRDFHRKCICLTYPRCPVEPEAMLDHFKELFKNKMIIYILIGQEHHDDEGLHLHCYIELDKKIRLNTLNFFDYKIGDIKYHPNVKEAFAKKGNVKGKGKWGWFEYIRKEGFKILEFGTAPIQPTVKKTTKEINAIIIKGGEQITTLVEEGDIPAKDFPRWYQGKLLYDRLKNKYSKEAQWRNVTVKWYWGDKGSGKTVKAVDEAADAGETAWISDGKDLEWFDDYDGEKYVILDELRKGTGKWPYLLRLLDGHRMNVAVKGGYAAFKATNIYITSSKPPERIFKNKEGNIWDSFEQLMRRITEVKHFTSDDPYECNALRLEREAREREAQELVNGMQEELAETQREHDKQLEVEHPIPIRLPTLSELSPVISHMEECSSLTDLELTPTWESDK